MFFIFFSTGGVLTMIISCVLGCFFWIFWLTSPILWWFLSILKVRSQRGLLHTCQRIKGTVMASSDCAHCSVLQLQYYDLLITCSAASVFYNGPEAESGSRSGFKDIRDSANPRHVIVFFMLIRPSTTRIISTYSMVIWDTTSNVV